MSLHVNASGGVTYQSNVFYTSTDRRSDVFATVTPGLEFKFGKEETEFFGRLLVQESFRFHEAEKVLNNELGRVRFDANHNTGVFDTKGRFSWYQADSPSHNLLDAFNVHDRLIEREVTDFDVRSEYRFSDKASVATGGRVGHINYRTTELRRDFRQSVGLQGGYIDRTVFEVPLEVYYSVSPKLDLSAGYRYRTTEMGIGNDFRNHFVNFGARGELLPKVNGEVRVGYQQHRVVSAETTGSFGANARVTWSASPKIQMGIDGLRDFAISGEGQQVHRTGGAMDVSYIISPLVMGTVAAAYTSSEYRGSTRQDDSWNLRLGVTYRPNDFVRFSADYIIQDNDSTTSTMNYSNSIINFTASLRY